jgi:hypothetical protein
MTTAQFWDWFRANDRGLWEAADHDGEELEELSDALSSYREGLCFEISDEENGTREMVISAAGDRRLFGAVDELVKQAPQLDRWRVTALKPPRGFDFVLDTPTVHLDPKTIVFEPLSSGADPRLLGIRIYLPARRVGRDAQEAALRAVETGLGEQARAEIEHIDVAPLKGSPADHIPLVDLPAYVEWFKAKAPAP